MQQFVRNYILLIIVEVIVAVVVEVVVVVMAVVVVVNIDSVFLEGGSRGKRERQRGRRGR